MTNLLHGSRPKDTVIRDGPFASIFISFFITRNNLYNLLNEGGNYFKGPHSYWERAAQYTWPTLSMPCDIYHKKSYVCSTRAKSCDDVLTFLSLCPVKTIIIFTYRVLKLTFKRPHANLDDTAMISLKPEIGEVDNHTYRCYTRFVIV